MPEPNRHIQTGEPIATPRGGLARLLLQLGPGLITGAADDDPSGIATYSQVGAQFGMGMLWTTLFSLPLMAAIQLICARLGRITGIGIADNLRKHYAKPLLYAVVALLLVANIFNLGADVSAMGAAAQLIVPGNRNLYAVIFGAISLALQILVPYRKYSNYLKWLSLVLFAYIGTAFVVHISWLQAIRATFAPSLTWNSAYLMALVGVLGTTISPYLFFWQSAEEVEEVRAHKSESALTEKPSQAPRQLRRIEVDTWAGMAISNIVAFFIILTTGATLHGSGAGAGIQSAADAAKALQPLAGNLASLLFAVGIIGTGLIAVPVLAGSAAYAIAGTFDWPASLGKTARRAPKFYGALAAIMLLGIAVIFAGLNPIRALFLAAVANGIAAVPLMILIMLMAQNPRVTREFTLPRWMSILGWVATGVMLAAAGAFLIATLRK